MYAQIALNPFEVPPSLVAMQGGRVMYLHDDCGCSRRKQSKMGAGSAVGEAVGSGLLSAAAATGPAAPFVAAAGEIIKIISDFFGGGCGQACIQSAELEQVPEIALDDLHAVALAQPGAVSGPMFQEAWENIISYGIQQLQALQAKGDASAANGITNLQKSTDYTSFVASLPETPTVALDINAAQTQILSPSAAGYYAASLSAGNQLGQQILESWASGSSSTSSTVTAIETATGLSSTTLLLGAGVLAYFLLGR